MKVSEKLYIKNFYTIEEFDWEIKEFNVLTGGMGSGKSVCIKLLWFCERILHTLFFYSTITKDDMSSNAVYSRMAEAFKETFYMGDFDFSATEIKYSYTCNGNMFDLQATWDNGSHSLRWESRYIDSRLKIWQEFFGNDKSSKFDTSFIASNRIYKSISKDFHKTFPIGTLFFPAARVIAAITDNTDFLDPFVVRFIKIRKWIEHQFKNMSSEDIFDEDMTEILHAKSIRYDEKQGLQITLLNGCEISPLYLSSGQQELLYLILLMDYLKQTSIGSEYNPINFSNRTSVYIEEPEAHLFPQNQKAALEYIAKTFRLFKDKRKRSDRFFITTHSPYVLNIINNMLKKGYLIRQANECADGTQKRQIQNAIEKINFSHLDIGEVSAHFIQKNVKDMINDREKDAYIYEQMIENISLSIANDCNNINELLDKLVG